MNKLHIEIEQSPEIIDWLNKQADKVQAQGHVGTHIDCYDKIPDKAEFDVEACVIDCNGAMPSVSSLTATPSLQGKALILYTENMRKNKYGTRAYFEADTTLKSEVLDAIIALNPLFIIIDSHGIGNHGEEHIKFDKLCESHKCHVIENVLLDNLKHSDTLCLSISIDINNPSSGKPCKLFIL